MSLNKHSSSPTGVYNRSGVASIEFVVFIPLWLMLVVWLLTLFWATYIKTDNLMAARLGTWENRLVTPPNGAERLRAVYTGDHNIFGFSRGQRIGLHKIKKAANLSLPFGETANLSDESVLLGGSWDKRQIQFENETDRSPLAVDKLTIAVASRVLRAGFHSELGLADELRGRKLTTKPEEGWIDKEDVPSDMLNKMLDGLDDHALAELKQGLSDRNFSLSDLKQAVKSGTETIQQLLPDETDSETQNERAIAQ